MAAFLPSDIIANIPLYDGASSYITWLTLFDDRCAHFGKASDWKLLNMEKFLLSTAADSWAFSKKAFVTGLTAHNCNGKFTNFCAAFKADFSELDAVKLATAENLKLKFRVDVDDMKSYVFRKRSLFAQMDGRMTEQRQLEYLFDGLPFDLRWTVKRQLGAQGTVAQFLTKLQCFAAEMRKFKDVVEAQLKQSRGASVPVFDSAPPRVTQHVVSSIVSSHSSQQQWCGYCGGADHSIKDCDLHRKDFVLSQSNHPFVSDPQGHSHYRAWDGGSYYQATTFQPALKTLSSAVNPRESENY